MGYLEKLVTLRFEVTRLILNKSTLTKENYEDLRGKLILLNELIKRYRADRKINEISLNSIEDSITSIKSR